MDHARRQQGLRESLGHHRLDALLVTHLPNIRYLCGFSGSAGVLLVSQAGSVFFTDGRYSAQAHAEVKASKVLIERKAPLVAAADWMAKARKKRRAGSPHIVGIEGEILTVASQRRLKAALSSTWRIKTAPPLVEQARMIKDADEVGRLRAACLLGVSLFDTALRNIRPGVKETQVAAEMEYAARKGGAEQMSFDTIIGSGKRSALPHGRASEASIPAQGFVVCDFGVILTGYCSDMTRTVSVGRPGRLALHAYEAVLEAQQAAVEAVQPGATTGEVDQAARKLLQKSGLARYFTHSTGHGVGLEIHEAPRVASGEREVLRPGMVITIEPGIYQPGRWGVRIEDMVVVRERGCEVLTPARKELIVL